jgi:hypothetical protein
MNVGTLCFLLGRVEALFVETLTNLTESGKSLFLDLRDSCLGNGTGSHKILSGCD